MKNMFISYIGLLSILIFLGCNKAGIPSDKYLIFEENFTGDYTWMIDGEIDNSVIEPGEADGEIENGVLNLYATACTEVTAVYEFTSSEILNEDYQNMTINTDINEYYASPIISDDTEIEISFKNFCLRIRPKQDISNLSLVFDLHNDNLILLNETKAVEYDFNTISDNNRIYIKLRSEGIGDCTASSVLKLGSIKIYRK